MKAKKALDDLILFSVLFVAAILFYFFVIPSQIHMTVLAKAEAFSPDTFPNFVTIVFILSAAAGALASNWILRRWRCWGNASLLRKEGLTKTCFRRSSFLNKDNHASRGYLLKIQSLAVRGGFEPPEPLRVRQFSKLLVSATHPSHRVGSAKVVIFY